MMQIAAWLLIGWIFTCCVATFVIAFVHPVLPELPSREYADEFAANLSGSAHTPRSHAESDTTVRP